MCWDLSSQFHKRTPPYFTNITRIFRPSCAVLLQIIVAEKGKGALPPRGEGKLCPGRSQDTELGCQGCPHPCDSLVGIAEKIYCE